MLTTTKIIRYALLSIVPFLLLGLLWWYFFLNSESQRITDNDVSRGYTESTEPFQNVIGNTYNNIVSGIASFINNTGAGEEGGENAAPQLWHVTKTPVAGMSFVESGDLLRLRFVERSTGQILEADPQKGTSARVTNKLFPKTYEAIFGRAGDVILRSLDDLGSLTSFSGTIATSSAYSSSDDASPTSLAELSGKNLERGIREIVPIPETREMLYTIESPLGGTDLIRSMWDGSKKKTVFSSSLSNWKPVILAGRIFLVQNPADDIAGFAYELENGALAAQVRNIPGLTFLPHASSQAILFGTSQDGTLTLYVRTTENAQMEYLPIKTIADKCVWTPSQVSTSSKQTLLGTSMLVAYCAVPQYVPSSNFINDWYRGAAHTSDTWWRVDANTGTVEPVTSGGSETFDVENPIIDADGRNIAFMNSQDKTLWLLRISADTNPAPTASQ